MAIDRSLSAAECDAGAGARGQARVAFEAKRRKQRAAGPPRELTSQHRGVSWNKKHNKWYAYIQVNGVSQKLGTFADEEEAAAAYQIAAAAAVHLRASHFIAESAQPRGHPGHHPTEPAQGGHKVQAMAMSARPARLKSLWSR